MHTPHGVAIRNAVAECIGQLGVGWGVVLWNVKAKPVEKIVKDAPEARLREACPHICNCKLTKRKPGCNARGETRLNHTVMAHTRWYAQGLSLDQHGRVVVHAQTVTKIQRRKNSAYRWNRAVASVPLALERTLSPPG